MNKRQENLDSFNRLLDIMDELREKCPWDREQTNESLRANTIEETYELSEAILNNDQEEIKKELGDLLLHIIFYAKIGEENNSFDIGDVCNAISDKLVFRHPHVFGDKSIESAELVEKSWEQIKMTEKGGNKRILDGVPNSLPALIKAYRIQDKARNSGFDWNVRRDVWDKVNEEMSELKIEIEKMNQDRMEAEFGDLLFSIVNAARLYHVNPDNALERTNRKFIKRFNYLEKEAKQNGRNLKDMTLSEMEEIWQEAKKEDVE
ncbi:MAG: nucleoside triphosphate pyrophosphohydrolase [Dysgonamonadaceae bacterium]|jgi:XTP/dITP diphosphohydrolase|nr:nucleoside triphosphate pyrophosphohydrolase [Dysgonamonadaceae bacterium]MDD3356419.1 nucleoside triphosphate pyrophosphohydrolase [Dysgonamonadaceae bacterium]MDD3728379.1 nucleoside triphosphate pyrophosphohydrolase [Dysgonamonadaceae bacterium]MDD4245905.1 nucleoside triphosphate pyrophosphohydrolase [Dysgonamonadaceae bacterium]MDD4606463.1 nucleoside triphosphate pyrophosphohydrolase [Dysgonamonadaceae bacterium]